MKKILIIFLLTGAALGARGLSEPAAAPQETSPSLAERLGYEREARLLIVHADDVGVSHSVNSATFRALELGLVSSASIMVPCPWLPEVAEYARSHPEADFGLHLTLNAEWEIYKWGPVAPTSQVSTLVNPFGYFYATIPEAVKQIDPKEAATEIRAQIEKALAMGIRPTHLDSHMGTLFQTRELFQVYLDAGREYGLPVLMAPGFRPSEDDFYGIELGPRDIVIDRVAAADPTISPDEWVDFYTRLISTLEPGVTELIVHLAEDDEEMRAVTTRRPHWYEAAWRRRDFDFVTSEHFAWLLRKHRIRLITWRELGKLIQ